MALQDPKDLSTALKAKEKELRGLLMARTRGQRLKRHLKKGNIAGVINIIGETRG